MWDIVFSIPIPNVTGVVSGFCVGVTVSTVVIVWVGLRATTPKEDDGISFEDIMAVDTNGEEAS